MKEHLMIADDGDLYDLRLGRIFTKPLRRNYRRHFSRIDTVAQFKATLRAGRFAWPGGFPLYFMCEDGEPFCFGCAGDKGITPIVMQAIKDRDNTGWRIVACEVNYEDNRLHCTQCDGKIESAYGETE